MANWLERAKREIPQIAGADTAKPDERIPSAVTAVPEPGESESVSASIGSNGSALAQIFREIEVDSAMTGAHECMIKSWLAQIGETDDAIILHVLNRCRQDLDERNYFMQLASDAPRLDPFPDDRRCCSQCANLRWLVCSIAHPGGVVSANRGYQPVPDLLRRCAGYVPTLDA